MARKQSGRTVYAGRGRARGRRSDARLWQRARRMRLADRNRRLVRDAQLGRRPPADLLDVRLLLEREPHGIPPRRRRIDALAERLTIAIELVQLRLDRPPDHR